MCCYPDKNKSRLYVYPSYRCRLNNAYLEVQNRENICPFYISWTTTNMNFLTNSLGIFSSYAYTLLILFLTYMKIEIDLYLVLE